MLLNFIKLVNEKCVLHKIILDNDIELINVIKMNITCSKCRSFKDESEFYRNKSKKTGRDDMCKGCRRSYGLIRRKKDQVYIYPLKSEFMKNVKKESKRRKSGLPKILPVGDYFVYMFKSGDEVVYIGSTANLYGRIRRHIFCGDITNNSDSFCCCVFKSEADMAVAEILLINKYEPKLNKRTYSGPVSFNMAGTDWIKVNVHDFS